ncbi:MAG: hypothetical protein EAZ32_14855 [Cytophagia bacterium]|nr:MAG: hypothetical protein EAZ46_10450 [Runella sp.]TAG37574.1 MAG: hypothetical protein EAZ32_14855 [Cytophagia bacterium]
MQTSKQPQTYDKNTQMNKNLKKGIANPGKNLKKAIKCFGITLLAAQSLFAQDTTTHKKSSWEVAIDLLPLIDKKVDPAGYLVRRIVSTEKAYRFKFRPSVTTIGYNVPVYVWGVYAAVGIEKRKTIYDGLVIYYGSDLSIGYYETRVKNNTGTGLSNELNILVSPFIGTQYYFHKKISAGFESHFPAGFMGSWARGFDSNSAFSYSEAFRAELKPLYCLQVCYRF